MHVSFQTAVSKLGPVQRLAPQVPALLVILPGFAAVLSAAHRASWTTLGRDQGIFQYIAWAIRQGDVLYRDIRDVNGPVIPLIHVVFQKLGGEDEHRFRLLDLIFTGLSFAIAGALLPRRREERPAWAVAAFIALMAQYLAYSWWDTAQRESFLDWFVLVSVALVYAASEASSRKGTAMLVLAGATSVVPWFGKPTFLLFTLVTLMTLALERDRWRRIALFALGAPLGAVVPLVFLLMKGDVRAFVRISTFDVPTMYRFIWPRPMLQTITLPGYSTTLLLATLTAIAGFVLIALRILPRRAIPVAAMPILAIVSMLAQRKGFPYHFHPITLGMTYAWLVGVSAFAERGSFGKTSSKWFEYAALACSLFVGLHAMRLAQTSWYPTVAESKTNLEVYNRVDYFPIPMRKGAAAVIENTKPDDRVQMYAMDAYLLFLARRRSATPYIYAYDLNADAALAGEAVYGGEPPTAKEQAAIRALRDAHSEDLFQRVTASPPAAFVLVDLSPLMSSGDAADDLAAHSPAVDAYVREHYNELDTDYPVAVWVRRQDAHSSPTETPESE